MSDDIEFIDGLIFKEKHQNAPDFVICKMSIRIAEMIAWLQAKQASGDEWVNGDVKRSKQGKIYSAVANWKPNQDREQAPQRQEPAARQPAPQQAQMDDFADDDIPF